MNKWLFLFTSLVSDLYVFSCQSDIYENRIWAHLEPKVIYLNELFM